MGVMVLATGAIAAPLFPSPNQVSQSPASTPTNTNPASEGDVIVNTEPANPASTGRPGSPSRLAGTRFSCQVSNGQYVVMYHPESQPNQSYPWATPSVLGGGWTSERRCNEISRRLEAYRPDGLLEMRTGVENGYNTVCVTTERVPGCRIVLTVPPGQDATTTRDRVFQNLTVADSGQQTQAVNTFVPGGQAGSIVDTLGQMLNVKVPGLIGSSRSTDGIDLRPFLDRADGGTGANLTRSSAYRPAPRLNPNRFR